MVIKKDLIIAVLSTFWLTATLFMIMPTRSSSSRVYDPWIDINDDGKIDMMDIGYVCLAYGTNGTAINKTALLLELQSRVNILNGSLLDLEAYFETRINTLNATLVEQQSRIADLETQLIILNATKLGKPDYDSGWVTVNAGNYLTLTHNLNTTEVFVYVVGRLGPPDDHIIHQLHYGGYGYYLYDGTGHVYASRYEGLKWTGLTNTTIGLVRSSGDTDWQQVRVLIWKIPQ